MNQQKQKNQNNRKFLYLLAGMLLLIGAIGVVSAKQTASIYDAPDLHLVQGSEKYDLEEGITYDSGKYELAVKDMGDFDIQTIGKYEVSYTLTPKGEAVDKKDGKDEKAQSTEEESAEQSTEKSTVQSAEEDNAKQTVEDSKAVSENKDKAATQADDKTTVEESADETSDTNTKETKSDTKEAESDSDEETILFKRTVFVEGKDGQKDYIYAPELEVQAGSTDYDLLADVEVRNLADDSVVEEAEVTVEDMSELEENAMTEEEQAEAKDGQNAEEQEGSMPPLKEGEYKVTLSAVGEDDETITVERTIVVLSEEDTGTVYFESLAGDKGWINSITSGVIKQGTSGLTFWYHEFNEKRIAGPYEGGSQKFQGLYGKVPAWYYITETDIADTLAGRAGYYRKMQRYEAKNYPGYEPWPGVDKNLEERKGDWSNFLPDGVRTGKALKDGGEPDVKFTLKKDATQKLTFGDLDNYITNRDGSSLVIDGEKNTHTFDIRYSTVGISMDNARFPFPVDQVEIKNVNFELSNTTRHSGLSSNKWLRLKGLTINEKNRDWGKIIDVTAPSIELILDNPKNPIYTINSTGNYNRYDELLVKAGSEDAENPVSISHINDYNNTFHTVIDTSEGGNLTFSIFNVKRSVNGNSEVVLQGDGKIIFDNRLNSDWNSGEDSENASQKSTYNLDVIPALRGSVVTLKNNITIAKTHLIREYNTKGLNDRKTTFALSLDQKLNSNGYKITFEGNKYDLDTDNETVVGNTEALDGEFGVSPRTNLDPTDYALSLTEKDGKYYYLTLADNAKRVVVTSSDHQPIQVSPAVDGTEYFADYKTALEAIRDKGEPDADYIITNDQDVDFGYGDTNNETATALASITDAHAKSLTFKSATRKADIDGNVAQGNYGEHYLVRMRTRKIVLNPSVPVTFEDMVMKYDQGTQAEVKATADDGTVTYYDDLVFDANGSNLTFAGTTSFWKDNGVDEKQMYPTVYGAGSGFAKDLNVTEGNAANAKITVAEGGSVVVGNIYNYSTLTNNGSLEVTGEIDAQKDGNAYKGETILGGADSELILSNAEGKKSMGSLKVAEDATAKPKLKLARVAEVEGKDASNQNNPYILNLTDENPLKVLKDGVQLIEVSYCSGEGTHNDVIFNLPNVADRRNVTVEPLYSGFSLGLFPEKDKKFICLKETKILVIDDNTQDKHRETGLGEAILEISKLNSKTPDHTYTISFTKNDYKVVDFDREVLEYVLGTKSGTYTYQDIDYPDLAKVAEIGKLTWCGTFTETGANADTYGTVTSTEDLVFFGKETVIRDINWSISNGKGMYANGEPLVFDGNVTFADGTVTPISGSDPAGNKAAAEIKVQKSMTAGSFVTFKDLTVGEGGTTQTVLTLTGKIQATPATKSKKAKNTNAVQKLLQFFSGNDEDTDDKADAQAQSSTGTVSLKNAHLKLTGLESSSFTSLVADNNNNQLTIPKDDTTKKTYPIQLSEKTELADATKKIQVNTATTATEGDKVVVYADKANADAAQYQNASFKVVQEENILFLKNDAKPIMKIELYEKDKTDKDFVKKAAYETYTDAFRAVGEGDSNKDYKFVNLVQTEFRSEDAQTLLEERKANSFTFEGGAYNAAYGGENRDGYYMVIMKMNNITLPSNYEVIWNQTVYHDGASESNRFEFYNNGGTLTFGERFSSRERGNATYDFIVYGGAASGECNKNVTINIFAGQFYEIYGGNKEGKHTGDVKINLSVPTEKAKDRSYLHIYRLDGASADNGTNDTTSNRQVLDDMIAAYKAGRTEVNGQWTFPEIERDNSNATVEITITNEVDTAKYNTMDDLTKRNYSIQVNNLFNYDTFTVEQGMFYQPDERDGDYNVNTISSLVKGYKGKTVIADGAEIFFLQNLGYRRLGSLVGKESKVSTTTARLYYVLQGVFAGKGYDSKENPWAICLSDKDPFGLESFNGHRVSVASYGGEHQNDVVFNLTGLETGTESHYTSTKTLESTFENFRLYPDADDTTIRLDNSTVMLIDGNGNRSRYENIAAAIVAISERETKDADGNYPKGEYTIAFYKGGDYTTSENDLLAMKLAAGKGGPDEKFTYQGVEYDLSNVSQASKITWNGHMNSAGARARDWSVLHPTGELNFFGTNTEIAGLQLNYDKYTSGESQSKDIYANGSSLIFADYSHVPGTEYPNLYGGSKDKTKKGGDITILSRGDWMRLNDVRDFKTLTLGENTNGRPYVTIYGKLDSNQTGVTANRTGKLVLHNAEIRFYGDAEGHIGNVEADKNTNTINIHKTADGTKTLYVDNGLKLADAEQKITLTMNGVAASRKDILVQLKDEIAEEQVKLVKSGCAGYDSIKATKDKKALILENMSAMRWKYTSQSGLDGYFREFNGLSETSLAAEVGGKSPSTKGDWSRFQKKGKTSGLVEIGEDGSLKWIDEPEVSAQVITGSQPSEYYWSFGTLLGEFNPLISSVDNADTSSSIELDFGNDGTAGSGSIFKWVDGYPLIMDNMQLSIKGFRIGDENQWNGHEATIKGISLMGNQVLRLDSAYGNGYGWIVNSWGNKLEYGPNAIGVYSGWSNGYPESPDAIVQVRLADNITMNPAYQLGWKVGSVMIQSGKAIPDNEISIINFLKTAQIDLKENNTVKFAGIYGMDVKDTLVEFLGTGKVYMTNLVQTRGNYGITEATDKISANTVLLRGGDVTVAKGRTDMDSDAIYVKKELTMNGFKFKGMRVEGTQTGTKEAALRENEVFAKAESTSLDATDFVLENPADGDSGLYFTSKDEGKTIYVKKFTKPDSTEALDKPIEVDHPDGTKHYYATYESALTTDEMANAIEGTYTIRNLVEREFTDLDAEALKTFSSKNVSLVFESGTRTDKDGAAGTLYRVRMRVQNLELPAGVDVTFQNIVMKYDEGTQTEAKDKNGKITSYDMTFAGNGGTLAFGEGVVFLKHNDEVMTPTIYGGSTTKDLNQDSSVLIKANCEAKFAAVYGAGTKAQTGKASVAIYGGTVGKLFGAGTGNGTVTGNVTVNVSGGTISSPIYGGGDGAGVTGDTAVTINHDKLGEAGIFQSIYGGGKGAKVTGNTTVTVTVPNKADAATFSMDTISGSGTNEEGTALENNVTGDKTVTIAMKNSDQSGTLELKTLAGFTTLNLGDENASYNHSIFKVSDRFDSNAQENNVERTGTVNLKHSSLTVNSSKQGHIGSMVVSGESELNVYKAESTSPLKVDGTVTVEKGIRLRINAMKDGTEDNALGDRILEFKTSSHANRNSYVDGSGKNLSVGTEKGFILFKDSTGHDVSSWVEYPGADAGALTDKLDANVNQTTVSKILHFDYDAGNGDAVRDGYVIAVPKDITEAAEQVKYSKVDSGFCKDGTFSETFVQTFTEGTDYWKITFTKNADGNGATGATPAIEINNQSFIYVAHIVCDAVGEDERRNHVTTFIVDTSAPKQDTEATKVEQIDQDGATESVTYTLSVTDPVLAQENLPAKDEAGKTHMTYTPAGIDQVFWAISGEKDKNYVNAKADAQAAQREAKVDQPDGTGLNGTGTATADGKIELTISKAKLDKAKEDGKNLWVYVKDGENNTMKMMINLNEDVINVRVPLNVNVVAVKKAEGGDCELLAPNCYVVNDGSKEVTAAVNGFTTKEAKNLKLVKDKAADQTYGANEIALQLMPSTNGQTKNTFDKTNVLTLGRTNMLNIGTMQPKDNEGRIIGYTFDAAYNVKEINVPDEWISNTMSYHFTVKK